jgi:hypothetical protein
MLETMGVDSPLDAAMEARAIPVLPDVGSIRVVCTAPQTQLT